MFPEEAVQAVKMLGETMSLKMTEDYQERWWKDIE